MCWTLIIESEKFDIPLLKYPDQKLVKVICSLNSCFYSSNFILFHCHPVVGWPKAKQKSFFWEQEIVTLIVTEYLVVVATVHTFLNRPSLSLWLLKWHCTMRFSSVVIDYIVLILFCFWSNAKAIHLATRKQRR